MPIKTFSLFSQQQSPKDYDRRKRLAQMLMDEGGRAGAAYNTGQGLAIAAPKILGGLLDKMSDDEEKQQEDEAWSGILKAVTGGLDADTVSSPLASSGSPSSSADPSAAPSGGRSGGGSRAAAAGERKSRAVQRLVEKGYSPHAAEGVADNLFDESAFNPKAVGDNGTAFGLAQWRGDRLKNLKQFAASQSRDWQDFDTQLDFVDHEMKNGLDEGAKIAYAKLQQAPDKDSAYNAFVQHYERPSADNLAKRLRRTRQEAGLRSVDEPPDAPALDSGLFDQQINAGLAMMRNPRTREAGFSLYQRGVAAKAEARQKAAQLGYAGQVEAWKYRRDRADKLDDEARKEGQKTYTLSPGQRVVDAEGNIVAEGAPKQASEGITLGYDEQGRPIVSMGGSGKPPTEMNQKYEQFFTRGRSANTILDRLDTALAKPERYIAEYGPQVAQDYLNSEEFKLAKNAADNFLVTIIRPDTGAAVTKQEFDIYGSIFLPRPNDTPAIIAQKQEARRTALEALKAGMKPEQILRTARPELFDGTSTVPKGVDDQTANTLLALQGRGKGTDGRDKGGAGAAKYKPGYTEDGYRFKGGDPTKAENWEKVQ